MEGNTLTPDAYGVWDTEEKRWFKRGPKACWCSRAAAANAWNASQPWNAAKYSQQKRFITLPIRFVPIEE